MRKFLFNIATMKLIVLITLLYGPLLNAAESGNDTLETGIYKALTEIQQEMNDGNNEKALSKLKPIVSDPAIKNYDAAVIYQTMAYAASGTGRYDEAVDYFKKALSYNALPEKVIHDINYATSELLIHSNKTTEGLTFLSRWFSNEIKPGPEAYILAATAYYHEENYQPMVEHVNKAIALSEQIPLNYYELLLAGYIQSKDYKNAVPVLKNIIKLHPERNNFWMQLVAIYQQLEQDHKALAVYELAYKNEILKKEDILNLARNYLFLDMPYKAGTLLEREMAIGAIGKDKKMLQLLVDSWVMAHEYDKAESVFTEIIKRFNDDSTRLRLGQLYLESEQWGKAVSILDTEIKTDDKTVKSKIKLLLGIAQFHSDNIAKASNAFTHALSDKSTEAQAKWWLDYLKGRAIANRASKG